MELDIRLTIVEVEMFGQVCKSKRQITVSRIVSIWHLTEVNGMF